MANMLKGTTAKVYDYIVKYSDRHGYQPSLREIAEETGIKSASTIFYHIEKLERLGFVKKSALKNRAIELTRTDPPASNKSENAHLRSIPVLGRVAAGLPVLAIENVSDSISVSDDLFSGNSLFFLRVKGDSMINAGIFEGDLIAVNKQDTANNGDIVVAMVGDEDVTVKRFFREKDYVRLQAENEKYAPIIGRDISVVGKVVGLIRSAI